MWVLICYILSTEGQPCGKYVVVYGQYSNKKYNNFFSINSTQDNGTYARLVNHSIKKANCVPKMIINKGKPVIYLEAKCVIEEGEELLYDYGEHKRDTIKSLPWLKD